MIRKAASVVVVLCLSSASLHADATKLTVSATSATVYKSPSVASPVVGHATRGAALDVTREVGDWVKVTWPSAPDGVGYVRTAMGTISRATGAAAPTGRAASATGSTRTAATPLSTSAAAAAPASAPRAEQRPVITATAPTPARTLTPLTHSFGVGASLGGSTVAFGASARKWSKGHLGMQLEVSRYAMTSAVEPGRLTATQFGPSVLYAMRDRFSDTLWMRPYAAVGVDWAQSTLSNSLTPGVSESKSTLGARVVVGSEFMFSNLPQLGISLDGGYYHRPSPFIGFEPKGAGVAVSAHWYMK